MSAARVPANDPVHSRRSRNHQSLNTTTRIGFFSTGLDLRLLRSCGLHCARRVCNVAGKGAEPVNASSPQSRARSPLARPRTSFGIAYSSLPKLLRALSREPDQSLMPAAADCSIPGSPTGFEIRFSVNNVRPARKRSSTVTASARASLGSLGSNSASRTPRRADGQLKNHCKEHSVFRPTDRCFVVRVIESNSL